MKKFLVLILGLSLTAVSCNDIFGDVLGGGSGVKGVFRSEDAGETFRLSNRVLPKGDINGLTVTSVALSPADSNIIYLGSSGGMYRSEDAGLSWQYILSNIAVTDIAIDPYKSEVLYAAGISGSKGKVIKSLDGGVSWVDVFTEASQNNAVTSISVSRGNSQVIVAGLTGGEIIRSTDGGQAWQSTTDLADRIVSVEFAPNGAVYALSSRKGLHKSPDNGVSWVQLTGSLSNPSLSSLDNTIFAATAFYDLGLDLRQSGVLYLGTEQGMFRSVNDGGSWSFMELPVKDTGLRVSAVGINPTNSNQIFTAVGPIIYKSANGGVTWQTRSLPTASEVRTIVIDPQNPNRVYIGLGTRRNN